MIEDPMTQLRLAAALPGLGNEVSMIDGRSVIAVTPFQEELEPAMTPWLTTP